MEADIVMKEMTSSDTNKRNENNTAHITVATGRCEEDGVLLKTDPEIPLSAPPHPVFDRGLRLKILHTTLISWASFAAAWRLTVIGPTFPDLMQITGVDVSVGSWLLTAFYVGNITGSFSAGFLYDRFSKMVVIVCIMASLDIGALIVPWCTSLTTMLIAHVFAGASFGAADVVTITDVIHVWGSKSVFVLQLAQFIYCIGAIVSPLVSAPFLSTKKEHSAQLNVQNITTNGCNNTPVTSLSTYESFDDSIDGNINKTVCSGNVDGMKNINESRMYIAYLISATITFVNVLALIIHFATNKNIYKTFTKDTCNKSHSKRHEGNSLSTRTKVYFVCSLAVLLMLNMIIERNFTNYLVSYVTVKEGWSKTSGSTATSIYWIAGAVSRLIATSLLVCVSLTHVMFLLLFIAGVSVLGLLVTLFIDADFLIWIFIALLGFALGPLYSAWFTWLSVNIVPASGKITGAMYITGVTGCSVFPPLIGYLLENFTYDWLIYILLILTPSMCIIFALVVLIHRYVITV